MKFFGRCAALTLLFCLTLSPCSAESDVSCERIISLAPSITETLYALGLDQQLVGVTPYDRYPAEVVRKAKVGGLLDPNYEAILALKPTLVFLLTEHQLTQQNLKKLSVETVSLDHQGIKGILDSIGSIGKRCNRDTQAQRLTKKLTRQLQSIEMLTRSKPTISTMIVIGSDPLNGKLQNIYLSGSDGFFSDLLHSAGGRNVHEGKTASIPSLSAEGILHLKPDVIVEVVSPGVVNDSELARALQRWEVLSDTPAVANDRVHIVTDDFMSIPGPRFIEGVKKLALLLHPDLGSKLMRES